jgi:hypothetical protein
MDDHADAAMTNEDRKAIVGAVESWRTAWASGNWRLATPHYAEDADGTNAFGVNCNGRRELEATLEHLFSLPHVMAGRDEVAWPRDPFRVSRRRACQDTRRPLRPADVV